MQRSVSQPRQAKTKRVRPHAPVDVIDDVNDLITLMGKCDSKTKGSKEMARLRSAPSVEPAAVNATTTTKRTALREKTNTTRARARVYENDGNTEDLVKNAKPRRGRSKKAAHNEDELLMGGALQQQDAPQTDELQERTEIATSEPQMTTDELAKSDGPPPPSAKPNRRPPRATRKAVRSEAQSKVLDGLKKRMEASARGQLSQVSAAPATTDAAASPSDQLMTEPIIARQVASPAGFNERSDFSLSPSPPPPGKLSSLTKAKRSAIAQPGSALRVQSTPGAETTILALKNFKRRPRQPSMLAMVQQRAMSARPSLTNATAHEDATVFDLNAEPSEIDDGFEPEAEGTPVVVSKAQPRKSESSGGKAAKKARPEQVMPVANSKKRKSDEADSGTSLEALRSKRQKSFVPSADNEMLVTTQYSASVQVPSSEKLGTPPPELDRSDVQVVHSSPYSTPPTEHSSRRASVDLGEIVFSTQKQQGQRVALNDVEVSAEQEDHLNGTMAEPASSPPPSTFLLDHSAAHSTQDILAPPVTQLSPPRGRETRGKQKPEKKVKAMSTATLQLLLPKRRQRLVPRRRKTEYDISSGSEDEGERDTTLEGSHPNTNEEPDARLRRHAKKPPVKGKKGPNAPKRKTAAGTRSPAVRRKNATSTPRHRGRIAAKPSKTYGRLTTIKTADKENTNYDIAAEDAEESVLPDASLDMSEVNANKELEQARRKFAEIDEFEMEFESVSVSGGEHRSSSLGWR